MDSRWRMVLVPSVVINLDPSAICVSQLLDVIRLTIQVFFALWLILLGEFRFCLESANKFNNMMPQ